MSARRVLVALLAVGMAVLSFDALRAYALTGRPLTDGVIPTQTIFERPWLAALWAVVVDLSVLTGIWAIKDDRRDWRAWLVLLIALGWTLGFQVFQLDPVVARAVPPIGLALAILVLDLGPAKERPAKVERTALLPYVQARLGTWDRSQSGTIPVPADVPVPVPDRSQAGTASKGGFSSVQKRMIRRWVTEGRSARWMTEELGLTESERIRKLGPAVAEIKASQNGGAP